MKNTKIKDIFVIVIGLAFCVFLGFTLIFNLTIIIKGMNNSEKPPSFLGITPMVVLSGSMSGTQEGHIEVGDLIFVKEINPKELKSGDVISYISGNVTVTHRIISVNNDTENGLSFTTKGDANNAEDTENVMAEQIIGVYLWRLPKAGDFALFMQTPIGMLIFIGIPVLAFVSYDIIRRQKREIVNNKKTKDMQEELERLRSYVNENNLSNKK